MPRNNRVLKPTTKRISSQIQELSEEKAERDACGRKIEGDAKFVWTDAAVERTLNGAMSAGLLGRCTALSWVRKADGALNIVVHDKDQDEVVQYGLDAETARPIRLAFVSLSELLRLELAVMRHA